MNDNDMTHLTEALKADHPADTSHWKAISTNVRAVITASVLRASGGHVSQKAVADAGGFDRSAFKGKASRSDQQTANERRRAVIDHDALGRLVNDLRNRAGQDEIDESDATRLTKANGTIHETRKARDAAIQSRGEIAAYGRIMHRKQQPTEPLKEPRRTTGNTVVPLFPNATTDTEETPDE